VKRPKLKRKTNYGNVIFEKPDYDELRKEYTILDMHTHSERSHDCQIHLKDMLKKAAKFGFGLAVTDHVRAENSIRACKQKKVLVVPGIEVNSIENKELLIYFYSAKDLQEFYEKYIKPYVTIKKEDKRKIITKRLQIVIVKKKMQQILEESEKYSCLQSIPHPYTLPTRRSHIFYSRKKRRELFKDIEGIEVINASMTRHINKQAMRWAKKSGKSITGGSDGHTLAEIGSAVVATHATTVEGVLESIRKRKNLVIGHELKYSQSLRDYIASQRYKKKEGIQKILHLEKEVHEKLLKEFFK